MRQEELVHDWNRQPDGFDWSSVSQVELDDETLRDGLQNSSAIDPPLERKVELLHLMDGLGIEAVAVGLPGAGPRAREATERLAREIVDARLSIRPNCAARTVVADIQPVAEISQRVGIPIEACTFIGSSPIRQYAEDWTLDRMLRAAEAAVTFAVGEGLPVMFVTEDTVRAHPDTLKALYSEAIRCGARRICLADTVGHATPDGVRALVRFVRREIIDPSGETVKLDWHGHRDRGLGLANALTAVEAGVDRVHGTALGMGERVGNVEMDQLLVNLRLLGVRNGDLTLLPRYCRVASEACGIDIPSGYPVVGRDAFRTGTGVHAAAIVKADGKGDSWLADLIYSGVPASWVGREQEIEVSPMSGLSNVKYWLRKRGLAADDEEICSRILTAAKAADRTLSEAELQALVHGQAAP